MRYIITISSFLEMKHDGGSYSIVVMTDSDFWHHSTRFRITQRNFDKHSNLSKLSL